MASLRRVRGARVEHLQLPKGSVRTVLQEPFTVPDGVAEALLKDGTKRWEAT